MNNFEETKIKLSSFEDKIGQKIEPKILDLVTALNCLNFITNSSCEGHLNKKGNFFPWVVIITDDSNIDFSNNDQAEEFFTINLNQQAKLIKLLSEFYQNRNTLYQYRLTAGIIPGCGTELMPLSGYSSGIISNNKTRQELFNIYQAEIKDFTYFLINKLD